MFVVTGVVGLALVALVVLYAFGMLGELIVLHVRRRLALRKEGSPRL